LSVQRTGSFSVVCCGHCGAIHGVIPNAAGPADAPAPTPTGAAAPPASSGKTSAVHSTVASKPRAKKTHPVLAELGNLDLTGKLPYSAEKIAARMRAAGGGVGSHYMQIAMDDGPPVCIHCKIEMKKIVIPPGLPNSGTKMWVCPNYWQCKQWELAED